jgi:hypothetical protein
MRLTKFGTYTLPLWNKRDGVSMGNMGGAVSGIIGGAGYDGYGTGTAPESALTVTTSFEIIETSATAVQTKRDEIRALGGTKNRLFATFPGGSEPGGVERFAWARLARVRMERRLEYIYYQPVDLDFEIVSPGWRMFASAPWNLGDGLFLDVGLYLDWEGDAWTPTASGYTLTITTAGNRTVTDPIVAVFASGSETISQIGIACGDCDWIWKSTVPISGALVINCGTKSVYLNGADAYSVFTLNSGHATADWLQLQPGANTVTVTYTGNAGGTAKIAILYQDNYA